MFGVSLVLHAVAVATNLVENTTPSPPFPIDEDPGNRTLWDYMRSHLHDMTNDYLAFIRFRTGGKIDATSVERQWDLGAEYHREETLANWVWM